MYRKINKIYYVFKTIRTDYIEDLLFQIIYMAIAIQKTSANAKTTAMMIGVALQLNKNENKVVFFYLITKVKFFKLRRKNVSNN